MPTLIDFAEQFSQRLHQNPRLDSASRVTQFVAEVQASGEDLGKWDEDTWILALRKLGLSDSQIAVALEDVASWGVVDNDVWE